MDAAEVLFLPQMNTDGNFEFTDGHGWLMDTDQMIEAVIRLHLNSPIHCC